MKAKILMPKLKGKHQKLKPKNVKKTTYFKDD